MPKNPYNEFTCIQEQNKMKEIAIISPKILAFGVEVTKSSFKAKIKIIVNEATRFIDITSLSHCFIKNTAIMIEMKKDTPAIVGVEVL